MNITLYAVQPLHIYKDDTRDPEPYHYSSCWYIHKTLLNDDLAGPH